MLAILPSCMWIVAGRTPSGKTTRVERMIKLSTTEDTGDTEDKSYPNRFVPPCPWCPQWWRVERTTSRTRCSFQERPCSGAPNELAVLDNEPAAGQHGIGGASHLTALVRVVVDIHVQRLRRERDGPI